MSFYAGLDSNNLVHQIIDVPDDLDSSPLEYISEELGLDGVWVNAFYGPDGEKRYCNIGYLYLQEYDRFVPPKPYDSWVLDDRFLWQPPVAHPGDGLYTWNESNQQWLSVNIA